MLMLTELGLPGLILFAGFVVTATAGIVRSRAASPALAAAALAAGAYWLVHSSYDWFWNYPALTAPAIFLLGAALGAPLRTNPDPGIVKN
jgi:O-antigen ligase